MTKLAQPKGSVIHWYAKDGDRIIVTDRPQRMVDMLKARGEMFVVNVLDAPIPSLKRKSSARKVAE